MESTHLHTFYNQAHAVISRRLEEEIPAHYHYHCFRHTADVIEQSQIIGKAEGLSDTELALLRIAALFHDTGFLLQRQQHEMAGCAILRQSEGISMLSEAEIATITSCIMATKIPQSPQSKIEQVLCDADLDYLGRSDYSEIAELLFQEMLSCGEIQSKEQWKELQILFLSKHRYHTPYCQRQRESAKQERLNLISLL
ncbi:MAG: hypothetical protein RLZZ77_1644 [Bacteroidota bacterium]|jgi:predicted metal-dependent HD superfamily phosphohydrolase